VRFWRAPRGTLLHLRMGKVFTACGHRIVFTTWLAVIETPLPAVERVCAKCHEKWRSAEMVNRMFGIPA
jgi:hypothetical protein